MLRETLTAIASKLEATRLEAAGLAAEGDLEAAWALLDSEIGECVEALRSRLAADE